MKHLFQTQKLLNTKLRGKETEEIFGTYEACTTIGGNSPLKTCELRIKDYKPFRSPTVLCFRTKALNHPEISTNLLDDVLSCDILNDSSRGSARSRAPGRTRGWLARGAGCGRETCHRQPRLPGPWTLHSGRRGLGFDWNGGHYCLVQV